MINDYNLLQNWETIFKNRKIIIWGVGEKGKEMGENISEYTAKVMFVDSDKTKQGKYCGISILSPEEIVNDEEYAIVLSTDNLKIQESILKQIESMDLQFVEIYTWYAMQTVMAFMDNRKRVFAINQSMKNHKRWDKLEAAVGSIVYKQTMQEQMLVAGMVEKAVFVYQSKKVGSVSVSSSAKAAGIYAVHVHNFGFTKLEPCFLRNMIKKVSGKVISIVREPIARQISLLWHYWGTATSEFMNENRYKSLEEIENQFYAIPNREDEFEWYLKEFKDVLNINVYEYPFDKELGYSIIEKDGISLLLLKTECLNDLESVLGQFLGVKEFELVKGNIASYKKYKYAYQNYLQNVKIPRQFFDYYYCNNQYMDHFYTKEEKESFYQRWKEYLSL